MVWHCGWNITFKEKLPKTAREPVSGSVPAQGMESKNKFFLCTPRGKNKKRKEENQPGKNHLCLLRAAQTWGPGVEEKAGVFPFLFLPKEECEV